MKFVSAIVGSYDVHKHYVFCLFMKARNAYFVGRKHTSASNMREKQCLGAAFCENDLTLRRSGDKLCD